MRFSLAISMCDPSHYVPLARSAEAAGWDSVCVPDGGPWTEQTSAAYVTGGKRWWGPETPFLEPFVVVPAMAAVTERIRFHTNVYKLVTRSPLHAARTIASTWALAPGRLALGIGLGWNREEFEALGIDFDTRGRRTDEAIGIFRALLRGDWVEHSGRFFEIPRLKQAPAIPEALPIYGGGDSPAAMRRAARFCDGWIARAPTLEGVIDAIPSMHAALEQVDRDPEAFEILAMVPDAVEPQAVLRLAEAGVHEIELWPWNRYGVPLHDLAGKRDAVARFAEEVIVPVRDRLGGRA